MNFDGFTTWVLGAVGSIVLAVAAFKLMQHYVQSAWGEFITAVLGAAFVLGFTLAPETTKSILTTIWNTATGGA